MKSIVCESYSSPNKLKIQEVNIPELGKNEVLVKIKATSINDYDWSMVTGRPYLYRLLFGLRKPNNPVPGMELSGVVEKVGEEVSNWNAGDAVYGDTSAYGFGTFAEYISINEKALVKKPDFLSFEEAVALPHASMLAYQALVRVGGIKNDSRLLINGAGGGVGTFALQIAQLYRAQVSGVDTGDKLQKMKELDFEKILDYKKVDFTEEPDKYDLIIDNKTMKWPWRYLNVLKPGGRYVCIGGTPGKMLSLVLFKPLLAMFSRRSFHLLGLAANEDMEFIEKLYQEGKLRPIIDGPYKMEEIPMALERFGKGKHSGKVVIRIDEEKV